MIISSLSKTLAARGYDTLTAVQEAVTEPGLATSDLLVSAQTGSGKTVGFGLAIAPTLLGDSETLPPAAAPLALIVAPTRELAFQVMRELSWLYAEAGARVASCVGGMDMRDERRTLDRGAHIVVGTPGRLCDHIKRGSLDMTSLRAVVLDEADEMLDLGFREDLEFMLAAAPEDRRTLMFSATVPPMIAKLAQQFQRDAVRVSTQSGTKQHADITYQALRVAPQDAENAVINLLRYHDAQNAIVFANTRATVARLTARFANRGFSVVSLSGELSQSERTHALQAMRDGRARVCVATDVAARGIDLPNLELVIHAELPSNSEALLHRSGRTGRAGRKGISALIVPAKTAKKAERLLKFAKITAEWTTPPTPEDIEARDHERLLSDPVWSEEPTPAEAAFAEQLLAQHSPERIAAAYLRLYQSSWSAPEELSPPDSRPPAKDHKPFGPSAWFALSVGANDRAEARWLLPLLCRAGNLDKDCIGAIRVQPTETFVELTEASAPGFWNAIGPEGKLEDGVSVRRIEGAPDLGGRSAPRAPRDDLAPRRDARPSRDNDSDSARYKPRPEAAPEPKPAYQKPAAEKKPYDKPRQDKPRFDKPKPTPMTKAVEDGAVTPLRKTGGDKPHKAPKKVWDNKPAGAPKGKPGGKPYGKTAGKPGGKPFGKPSGKPAGKPFAKSDDRPSEPVKPRHTPAADASRRFTPPGMTGKPGKPGGGKPFGKGSGGKSPGGKGPGKKPTGKTGAPKGRPGFGGTTPPKRNKP
ncbi:DEAD/DEAH box helicase [uncultured Roseovarius sp.]|uniref:DEAD/DEAH box helicase n=1 Tax=uncultured Roseovarius sp. TaxID=293344 RepID=UPI0025DF5DC5|nr:DEAD/DEAH box helicase [uncultured Roseovarius sp.]